MRHTSIKVLPKPNHALFTLAQPPLGPNPLPPSLSTGSRAAKTSQFYTVQLYVYNSLKVMDTAIGDQDWNTDYKYDYKEHREDLQ